MIVRIHHDSALSMTRRWNFRIPEVDILGKVPHDVWCRRGHILHDLLMRGRQNDKTFSHNTRRGGCLKDGFLGDN